MDAVPQLLEPGRCRRPPDRIHTAEGATTIESLGNFFASSSAGVSSHAGADDKVNTVGEYVKRTNKAWTAANANPVAVQLELCGFASWSKSTWHGSHQRMLDNCARWIAEEGQPSTGS